MPNWANRPSWLGGSVDQNAENAHPGYGSGPLTPPQSAPVPAVQSSQLPVTATGMPATAADATIISTSPLAPATPVTPQAKTKVAILLPLTGKNAALGQSMLNAAQLAVFDSADNRFELMPRDTGSEGANAATAARDAVASGAQLLIGPVFANNIASIHAVAETANLGMLTLSTDTSMAAPNIYVMGFAPTAQVERVVTYASVHGLHHFAALVPANAYGKLVAAAFQESVLRHGGTLVMSESYDPAKHDSDKHIHKMALQRDQIDALFLPEGGSDLAVIANQLSLAGFDNHHIRLLGTGLWDVPDLAKQSSYLVGGWYVASDPMGRKNFVAAYKSTYGSEPPRLATLAYDATALAAVLSKRGAHFDVNALTNPNGFAGLDGIFRLTAQGLVERGLAVIEVSPDGPHVVDAAPTTFAGN